MKERGMIFNGEMVRAILDGRKTQTRRLLKWKQTRFTEIGERDDGRRWPWSEDAEHACDFWHPCPFGAVGDRIWVRETFAAFDADWKFPGRPHDLKDGPWPNIAYPASIAKVPPGTARPSIHMPRWASRITLEITDVRVERLASISDEDAGKEGYPADPSPFGGRMDKWLWFRQLWDGIYPEQSFKHNPWVWVIEFKRIEGGA